LIAGLALIIAYKQPFTTLFDGAISMVNLIGILVALQLFTVPVFVGNYGPAVESLVLRYAKKEKHLFIIVTIVSCLLASFLFAGTVPVVLAFLEKTIDKNVRNKNQFISAAISRGFTTALLWSPAALTLLFTMQATNTQWADIIPYLLLLCVFAMATSYVLEWRLVLHDRPIKMATHEQNIEVLPDGKTAWKQMLHIIMVVIGIVIGVYMLSSFTELSSTHCVIITGVIIFLLWMAALRRNSGKGAAMFNYFRDGILKSQDLGAMFIAIGIFTEAVKGSGITEYIQPYLSAATSQKYLFLALLPAVFLILSLIGIHSFISIVIVGNLLSTVNLPFSMVPVAIAIMSGSVLSYGISPFAGITLTISKYLNCSSFDVSVRWNGLYSILIYLESVIIIWLMVFFKI
jgi:hypothetical protein